MNFILSEEQKMLRETLRRFAEKEIKPLVEEYNEKEEYPDVVFKRCAEMGLLGILMPEKYGGSGPDALGACLFMEELSRIDGGIAASTLHQVSLGMPPIYLMGTEEQKMKYLVPAVKGEIKICFALTEPNGGSDNLSMRTTAKKEGRFYILNGSKTFSTNGGISDLLCVACKTDPEKGSKGISVILVDKDTPGFHVGKKIRKIGWHTSNTVELFFEDCKVPATNLIGKEGTGFLALMKTLYLGRILWSCYCIGIAQGAFEEALSYAKEREAFGKPIHKYQAIAFMIVDMAKEIDVARTYAYQAAAMYNQGIQCDYEASIAKLHASEMVERVTSKAVQIHGGYGFCKEYPVSRFFCDARIGQIGEGTSEIMKIIISRKLGL
ncbi:MAG: acyl-CoA dehydrogenase family protein [Deltaproteobacteria bacterium]|nr:acyl-CoA dehydrogenase family protein [Deltaproteobacteria bacterium]